MIAFRDPATGAQIRQVTEGPAINHPTYFLQSSFFPPAASGPEIFFTSYRTGSAQIFEASLCSGATRQITRGPAIHPFSAALHPDGETLVFTRGGSLWAIHRHTLAERPIVSQPGAELGECSISRDGQWLTAAFKSGAQCGLVAGRFDGSGWHTIPFPRTVIHPQFHPLEPEWIEFAGDPAPRMHRVRREGTPAPNASTNTATTSSWCMKPSSAIPAIWSSPSGRGPSAAWIGPPAKSAPSPSTTPGTSLPTGAADRILCDTNHPDEGLQIIDAATGARRPLCLSESSNQGSQWRHSHYALAADFAAARNTLSWMENAADTVYGPQWTHPHPSWSTDETMVAFASDRTGTAQVYVVEILPHVLTH